MSQNQQIEKHLSKGYSLNPIQALTKFGCFRLAARIADLRNNGMNIATKTIKLENNKIVAQYSLK